MSLKAARGTKRACQNCGGKFYDLNRDPIVCPLCSTVFQLVEVRHKPAIAGNAVVDDDEDELAAPSAGIDIVSLDEVEADEADLPDIEDAPLDIDDDEADLGDEDETFIEVEDEDDGEEVTGIVSGAREDED